MKKLLALCLLLLVGCSDESLEAVITAKDGKDGTSCSVAPEYAANESEEMAQSEIAIGARISCTDGSYSVILNGQTGAQGIQGVSGIQGPQGQAGKSCQAYRSILFSGVWLACPNQLPALISDGRDGEDGTSCTSTRQTGRVKIQCGHTTSYVYDGQKGQTGATGQSGTNGTSCTAVQASGGANVTCGGSTVFIANGQPGRDGLNGLDGEDAIRPGLSCNLHDLKNWDKKTSLPEALANNPVVGNFVLANLSVGDSPSSAGFPGMPKALQDKVGLEGYALDCNGYLNIKTSGEHTLKLLSDDGSRLSIEDDYLVIENQGLQAPTSKSKTDNLNRGQNKINVVYFQGPHTQIALELKISGPNTTEAVIPASEFTH